MEGLRGIDGTIYWVSCLTFQSLYHSCELDPRRTQNTPAVLSSTLSSELANPYVYFVECFDSNSICRENQGCKGLCLSSGSSMLTKIWNKININKNIVNTRMKNEIYMSLSACSYWWNVWPCIPHSVNFLYDFRHCIFWIHVNKICPDKINGGYFH